MTTATHAAALSISTDRTLPSAEIIPVSQRRGRGRFASACYIVRCDTPALSRACGSRVAATRYRDQLISTGQAVAA